MAFKLPNGAILEIATTLAAAKAVSAISNASPAVATAGAHGLKDGDVVVVRSGWTRLNDKAVRVTGSDTGTFKLEGIDTTKTTVYTAGAGTGSVRAVTAWAQISQITEVASTGGEQQFATTSRTGATNDYWRRHEQACSRRYYGLVRRGFVSV